jgi:hypothetical protein
MKIWKLLFKKYNDKVMLVVSKKKCTSIIVE